MDPCHDLAARKDAADRAVDEYVRARGWRARVPPTGAPAAETEELNQLVAEQRAAEQALTDCYSRDSLRSEP